MPRIAPTARDDEGRADPGKNPDLDHLLRGTVHDTTARRMGGVAGHAGLFSTAHDVSIFAQALLDRLAGRPSTFPLTQATSGADDDSAAARTYARANPSRQRRDPRSRRNETEHSGSAPRPALPGDQRDRTCAASAGISIPAYPHREAWSFRIGSFGHTGFTGTTLWIDPGSDTYVVLLSNSIHVRGSPPIQELRGDVATATAQVLHLYGSG